MHQRFATSRWCVSATSIDDRRGLADGAGALSARTRPSRDPAARLAVTYSQRDLRMRPAPIKGAVGAVSTRDEERLSVGGVTVRDRRIVASISSPIAPASAGST